MKIILNFAKKISLFIVVFLLYSLVATILLFSVRGNLGNPVSVELSETFWKEDGPFELSPERGRYGLLYSLIEDKSLYFSVNLARFIAPDLGYINERYVSLFPPAVSFVAVPGYLIGKYFEMSQVGAFVTITLFAFTNLLLISKIVVLITKNRIIGILSGMIFLFATPAYAYGVNLYQHHISTFLILFSILILISTKKIWPLFIVWFLCAMSIPVDYPNLFLMFPIGVFALFRIVKIIKTKDDVNIKININIYSVLTFIGLVLPILFFGWFNQNSYGNPFQFSGTVPSARAIDDNGKPTAPKGFDFEDVEKYINPDKQEKTTLNFFESRDILNGIYLHTASPDRGIIYFTPVMLVGLIGIIILQKKKNEYLPMLVGVVFSNLVLYSMWGDPWGGWAFGSRYLIPAYSILAIFTGVALSEFRRKWLFLALFYPILIYSVLVNTLGALTTSANPPKVEALALEAISGKRERYSYDRNWEFLTSGRSKSFVFQTWAKNYVGSVTYYYIISGTIILLTTSLLILAIIKKDENKN